MPQKQKPGAEKRVKIVKYCLSGGKNYGEMA